MDSVTVRLCRWIGSLSGYADQMEYCHYQVMQMESLSAYADGILSLSANTLSLSQCQLMKMEYYHCQLIHCHCHSVSLCRWNTINIIVSLCRWNTITVTHVGL